MLFNNKEATSSMFGKTKKAYLHNKDKKIVIHK